MIALLVVYTALGGAAFAGAAWCAERAALLARCPVRWSWAVALALTCALPAVAVGCAYAPAPTSGPAAIGSVPRDSIVSVDVLEGTAATARFGDAGRAGVVVITLGPPRPATQR